MDATLQAPPHSLEAEQSCLGAVLISDRVLPTLALDEALRPEHFYRERHGQLYAAMLALADKGEPVDSLTLAAELKRRGLVESEAQARSEIDALAAVPPSVSSVRSYARRVAETAELRAKAKAAYSILDAVAAEDRDALATAEGLLNVERAGATEVTAQALADELWQFMGGDAVECWPLPFSKLTRLLAGGLKRGESTVLSGHSSHGKSAFAGQVVDTVAAHFARTGEGRVRVYIAEGSTRNWGLRFVARRSQLNYGRLVQGRLNDSEHSAYAEAVASWAKLGVTLVPAHGWKPEDVARDVKRHRPDLWVVDLLNELDVGRGETHDWDRAVRTLTATPEQTDSHLLLLAHVNESRSSGSAKRPKPTLGDLRSTGMLKNAADQVLFVFREQDDDGEPLDSGEVYVRKARDARLGTVAVEFQGAYQRFVLGAGESDLGSS